jgi:hypothetical protein
MKRLIATGVLSFLAFVACADDSIIGYVKTVSGTATVATAGNTVTAEPGTPIHLNSVLKTGAGSAMGVTFKDNTVMSFGPGTEITMDEYLYTPSKDDLKLSARIARGTLEYISGVIAKLKPEAVAIKTPTGTIGVRGTHFLVKVDAPQSEKQAEVPRNSVDTADAATAQTAL